MQSYQFTQGGNLNDRILENIKETKKKHMQRESEIKQSGYKEERGNTLAYFILNKQN